MGVKDSTSQSERRQALKEKYLARLVPMIKHHRWSHMRIDDIVRFMGISKATFYKYFSSKEEVAEHVVDLVVSYFKQATTLIGDESSPYLLRFQDAFAQSLLIASHQPDAFLLDLKQSSPLLWERTQQAQQERQQKLQQFYEQGIAQGIFHPINPVLVMVQNEHLLRNIMDPAFLMEHDLTLRVLLYDYYELQKYQWLPPEIFRQMDDAPVRAYIDKMARHLSLGIRSYG